MIIQHLRYECNGYKCEDQCSVLSELQGRMVALVVDSGDGDGMYKVCGGIYGSVLS